MQDGSADRYFQEGEMSPKKLVPEGIEGRVPYKGPVARRAVPDGRRAAQRHGLRRLRRRSTSCARAAEFVRITTAGLRESHPHDVTITREAPNYIGIDRDRESAESGIGRTNLGMLSMRE